MSRRRKRQTTAHGRSLFLFYSFYILPSLKLLSIQAGRCVNTHQQWSAWMLHPDCLHFTLTPAWFHTVNICSLYLRCAPRYNGGRGCQNCLTDSAIHYYSLELITKHDSLPTNHCCPDEHNRFSQWVDRSWWNRIDASVVRVNGRARTFHAQLSVFVN